MNISAPNEAPSKHLSHIARAVCVGTKARGVSQRFNRTKQQMPMVSRKGIAPQGSRAVAPHRAPSQCHRAS
jgi:hypothetical protein